MVQQPLMKYSRYPSKTFGENSDTDDYFNCGMAAGEFDELLG